MTVFEITQRALEAASIGCFILVFKSLLMDLQENLIGYLRHETFGTDV